MLYFDNEYLYHATPIECIEDIMRSGLKPMFSNWKTFAGNQYDHESRIYLANSLIAAYDIAQNFIAHGKSSEYVIIKIKRNSLEIAGIELFDDEFFPKNWVYATSKIKKIHFHGELLYVDDLMNTFSDEELEWLYE